MPRPQSNLPLLRLQANQARLDAQQVQDYDQVGKALVTLVGSTMAAPTDTTPVDTQCEATVLVTFGSEFIEQPVFTYGSSVDQGSAIVDGSFPTLHAVVHAWVIDTTAPVGAAGWGALPQKPFALYTGATVGVVATGQVGQTLWLHYRFAGRAQPFGGGTGASTASNSPTSTTGLNTPSTMQIVFGLAVSTLSPGQAAPGALATPVPSGPLPPGGGGGSTLPGAPTSLIVTSGTDMVLGWTAPAGSGTDAITNYNILKGTSSGSEVLLATIGNLTTYTDTSVTSGNSYYYQVQAVTGVGTGPVSNEASGTVPGTSVNTGTGILSASAGNVASATHTGGQYVATGVLSASATRTAVGAASGGDILPGAPTSLSVTSGTSLVLNWTAPSSTGTDSITNYDVYRGSTSGSETLFTTLGNVHTYTDVSVTAGDIYYYEVAAVTNVGVGPKSNEASATVSSGGGSGGTFSLFAPTSLWKTTKTGVTFASAATATLSTLTYSLNNGQYCHPFYIAKATDPLTTFTCGAGWGHPAIVITANAPAGMAQAAGGDADMCVLLVAGTSIGGGWGTVSGQWLLDMYGVTGSGTSWNATYYGLSDGINGPGFGTYPTAIGTTAIGSPQCSGTILASDIAAGVIPHGLDMAFGGQYMGGVGTSGNDQIAPAVSNDDGSPDAGPLPEGGLMLIPASTAMPGGLSPMGQQLWIAAQTYGCYVTDTAGGGGFFYGDGSAAVGGAFASNDFQIVGQALQLVVTW